MDNATTTYTPDRGPARAPRNDSERRMGAAQAEAVRACTDGCPKCGRPVRLNLAISGWVQCEQFGEPQFRKDASAPACSWQGFLPVLRVR